MAGVDRRRRTFTPIAGANSPTLSVATVAADDGNEYEAVFANSIGRPRSRGGHPVRGHRPDRHHRSLRRRGDQGQTATFTAAAAGNPAPTVQWQVSTDGGTTFADVTGATSDTYPSRPPPGESGDEYQAVFTNVGGSATTTAATLTLDTLPVVGTNRSRSR